MVTRMGIFQGDCLDILKHLSDNCMDSIVTDPPYGLCFMGKKWDYDVPTIEIWRECLRVLKPGGHLLAFGGTRTYHRLVVAIEDSGFEIRDQIQWLYGQGFPKSKNLGTDAQKWSGWGTALKPANEPICLARKPLSESTIAKNVLKHGTGGLNIDGTRLAGKPRTTHAAGNIQGTAPQPMDWGNELRNSEIITPEAAGRFPSNVILDELAAQVLDEQTGILKSGTLKGDEYLQGKVQKNAYGSHKGHVSLSREGDSGGASRFFYVAKASKSDRGEGNSHPTVKPIKLMEYLINLVTPPNGVVLDPFMGSGTTGVAALRNGYRFFGCELNESYFQICKSRMEKENVAI